MLCISFRKCALYFLKKRLKGKGKKKKIQFSSWIKNREIMKWVICSQCLLYLTGETWSGPPFLLCCDTFPPFPWYSPVLPNRTPFLQHPESNSQGRSPPLHHRLCSARCPASHSLRSCKATSTTVASSQVPVIHGLSKTSLSPSPWSLLKDHLLQFWRWPGIFSSEEHKWHCSDLRTLLPGTLLWAAVSFMLFH